MLKGAAEKTQIVTQASEDRHFDLKFWHLEYARSWQSTYNNRSFMEINGALYHSVVESGRNDAAIHYGQQFIRDPSALKEHRIQPFRGSLRPRWCSTKVSEHTFMRYSNCHSDCFDNRLGRLARMDHCIISLFVCPSLCAPSTLIPLLTAILCCDALHMFGMLPQSLEVRTLSQRHDLRTAARQVLCVAARSHLVCIYWQGYMSTVREHSHTRAVLPNSGCPAKAWFLYWYTSNFSSLFTSFSVTAQQFHFPILANQ